MKIDNNQDILDSRDIQTRIDELESFVEEDIEEEEKEELVKLQAFKEEVNDDSEWDCGICFIHESHFEDYARELAEDVGAIGSDTQWPATCIDWEQAARELRMGYSEVDFDGSAYLYR